MQKRIKSFLDAAVASSIVAIVLGVLFLIFPVEALDVFRWIIAILAFAVGIFIIAGELSRKNTMPVFGATAIGAIMVVIGLVFAVRPAAINIFTIILGAWFIVTALSTLRFTAALNGAYAFFSVLLSLVALIAGILLIINPWGGSISIMVLLGACLIVFGAVSLANTFVLKRNVKDVAKQFEIKEAKIVKESKNSKESK